MPCVLTSSIKIVTETNMTACIFILKFRLFNQTKLCYQYMVYPVTCMISHVADVGLDRVLGLDNYIFVYARDKLHRNQREHQDWPIVRVIIASPSLWLPV